MTDKEKIAILENCFKETIWMAIRYANGRHTFAPSIVRDAVRDFQKVFPEWKPIHDLTIEKPTSDDIGDFRLEDDYLFDLVNL